MNRLDFQRFAVIDGRTVYSAVDFAPRYGFYPHQPTGLYRLYAQGRNQGYLITYSPFIKTETGTIQEVPSQAERVGSAPQLTLAKKAAQMDADRRRTGLLEESK